MKTVYLHIGYGKTGTTAQQHALNRGRQILDKNGVHYLHADDEGRGIGHQDLAKSFIVDRPAYMQPPREPAELRCRVKQELKSSASDTFLISSENFPLANAENVLDFFNDALPGVDVKIILFARSQDELVEAEYNQLVKMRELTSTIDSYANENRDNYDFHAMLQQWQARVGTSNIICRVYDASRRDAVEVIASCIPEVSADSVKSIAGLQEPSAQNESLGMKALLVAKLLNEIPIRKRHQIYPDFFEKLKAVDVPALFFDSDQAHRFRERYARSNALFTKTYFGEEREDLGGRRYSDRERDTIRRRIAGLKLSDF